MTRELETEVRPLFQNCLAVCAPSTALGEPHYTFINLNGALESSIPRIALPSFQLDLRSN